MLDRYHRRERDCITKWKDLHHSNQLSQLQEELKAARCEQTTKNNQLKEYRSKITALQQENETLKQEAILDPKPKKGFQCGIDCYHLHPIRESAERIFLKSRISQRLQFKKLKTNSKPWHTSNKIHMNDMHELKFLEKVSFIKKSIFYYALVVFKRRKRQQ